MKHGTADSAPQLIRLSAVKLGSRARLVRIDGGRNLTRRLLSLGIREGVEVEVLQRRGRGVVVSSAGARVAIGSSIAKKLFMHVLDEDS